MTNAAENFPTDRELVLTRIIDAPREKVFRAWTEPELLKQWFAPLPFTTPIAEVELRPGGANLIVMRDAQGNDMPNRGVYLEVVKNERLVFTNAYTKAWEPSEKPFMTAILTFEDMDGKTRYTARVLHWTVADREAHEKMGFHQARANAPTSLRLSSRNSKARKGTVDLTGHGAGRVPSPTFSETVDKLQNLSGARLRTWVPQPRAGEPRSAICANKSRDG